jgi:streptomycin 6-kinase
VTQWEVPDSFREQPRWWTEGTEWLDSLPELADRQCRAWRLEPDGAPWHGSNALVLPVTRDGEPLALRLAPPDERTRDEIAALAFWAGRGTVLQLDADQDRGASLLERLDGDRSLRHVDLDEAGRVLGTLMRRLAVPVSDHAVRRTSDIVDQRLAELADEWVATGQPFERSILSEAIRAGQDLTAITDEVAVNGDLHHDQVLAGRRDQWVVVDPLLYRGDIGYDLARCLWWRLDDMADDATIRRQLMVISRAAGIDHDHARTSVIFRTVDYWLWGLRAGLTEDPVRCARLLAAIR